MDNFMEVLLQALKAAKEESEVDLLPDLPGHKEFVEASEEEYDHKNYNKARRLYEKSCELGHPMGQCNYALWFLEGDRPGTQKNLQKAFDLFQQSSTKDIGMALYNLALFYYEGKGGVVGKDVQKAYTLAKKAIEDPRIDQRRNGGPYALLGAMHFKGEGCAKSYAEAERYFKKASDFGHPALPPTALRMLGLLKQMDPMEHQRMVDRKWDRMMAWLEDHPEEKPETMEEHDRIMKKFGFKVSGTLTEQQKKMKGGFNKFIEITGGFTSDMDEYEMKDAPFPPRKCGKCGKRGATSECGKCGEPYCNRDCQRRDWKDHKPVCQQVQYNML